MFSVSVCSVSTAVHVAVSRARRSSFGSSSSAIARAAVDSRGEPQERRSGRQGVLRLSARRLLLYPGSRTDCTALSELWKLVICFRFAHSYAALCGDDVLTKRSPRTWPYPYPGQHYSPKITTTLDCYFLDNRFDVRICISTQKSERKDTAQPSAVERVQLHQEAMLVKSIHEAADSGAELFCST